MALETIASEEALAARLAAPGPLLVYLSRAGCGVCQALRPRVEALLEAAEVPGAYVDVGALPSVAAQRLVFAVPTLIVFFDGREARRFGRHLDVTELSDLIDQLRE